MPIDFFPKKKEKVCSRHGCVFCELPQTDPTETTRSHEPHDLAHYGGAVDSDFISSRLRQPAPPTTSITTTTTTQPTTHDQTTGTTKAHGQNEDDTQDDDGQVDDDTLHFFFN